MSTVTQEDYFARIPKAVVYHSELTGNDVRVYATLSERAGGGRYAWPGIRRIATDLQLSTTTVQKALDKLEDLKLIEVERTAGEVNHYHLPIVPTVPENDTPPSQKMTHTVSDSDTELEQRTIHSPTESTSLFEAFYEFWTGRRYVEALELPKSMRGRLNAAVKEARLAGISAEAVRTAGRRYRDTWSRMERTPQALLANWSRFGLEDEPVADCETCGNRGLIWFGPDGERRAADDVDADTAAHCPDCHPEAI